MTSAGCILQPARLNLVQYPPLSGSLLRDSCECDGAHAFDEGRSKRDCVLAMLRDCGEAVPATVGIGRRDDDESQPLRVYRRAFYFCDDQITDAFELFELHAGADRWIFAVVGDDRMQSCSPELFEVLGDVQRNTRQNEPGVTLEEHDGSSVLAESEVDICDPAVAELVQVSPVLAGDALGLLEAGHVAARSGSANRLGAVLQPSVTARDDLYTPPSDTEEYGDVMRQVDVVANHGGEAGFVRDAGEHGVYVRDGRITAIAKSTGRDVFADDSSLPVADETQCGIAHLPF